ncbi:MAG: DedA family protein [Acidobacteria bacterium]|nr:MAG: DedA family protein [Acidobacteriota bacterium]
MDYLHQLLHDLLAWVESFARTPYGDWALFAIAFAESSVFPVPPDVLLIALCLGDPQRSFYFALLCTAGSVLGGAFGYGLGYVGGRPLLRRLFKPAHVQAVASYYDRYNAWATGAGGLTPLPYKLFTISGGAFAIDFKTFLLASLVARSLRFFAVAALIYAFGEPIKSFIDDYLGLLTIAFLVLLAVGYYLIARRAGSVARQAVEVGDD